MKKQNRWRICLAAVSAGAMALSFPMAAGAANAEAHLNTVAGVPGDGYADGERVAARFASPMGLDVRSGSIWIADTENNRIRVYADGMVSTLAGHTTGTDGYGNAAGGYQNGSFSGAKFNGPADCAFLSDGRLVITDRENHAIRVKGANTVYTLNGNGEAGYAEGIPGQARFSSPSGICEGADGNIYVADTGNHCIRRMDLKGVSSLVAGNPQKSGYQDGAAEEALFCEPSAVCAAADGSIYVADTGNQRIRRIYNGQVTTVAGGGTGTYLDTEYLAPGFMDGTGAAARFRFPEGICMAENVIIVADTGNHVIRAVSPDGRVAVIAGSGDAGYEDGEAKKAQLNSPGDVAWADGVLYIMDSGNSALRSMEFSPSEWLGSLE